MAAFQEIGLSSAHTYNQLHIYIYTTSSTAQGGGGSFKNRKPIGEVGCCESQMGRANPRMDRKVVGVVFFGVVAMVAVVTSPTTVGQCRRHEWYDA